MYVLATDDRFISLPINGRMNLAMLWAHIDSLYVAPDAAVASSITIMTSHVASLEAVDDGT